jgi:hypothetical protein
MSEAVLAPAAPAAAPAATPAPAVPAEGAQPAQNTAEQAPATAPEGEKPDTGQDPEKRGKSRYERRLDRAYKRAAEAQARAEFYEKQLNEQKASAAPAADPAAPKLEQFSDIEQYAAAKAEFEKTKALKEYQDKQQGETQKQQIARLNESWETKVEAISEKYDDWEDVVGDRIKPTNPTMMALMEAENGPDVAYFLAKNQKELARIDKLPLLAQILEVGRLSAKLAAEPPKPKTPSRAPAPITPVTGTAPVASNVPSESDDMKSWIAKRNKQVNAARK